ncbi:hypothetical protein [Pseudomonas sp. NPDC079086]|uniref:hypothetical protein n=1 Tax=unclassified Pseudomonas TaxID=196821 RepID=UPI0037CA7478
MNTISQQLNAQDYLETMQAVADSFLRRHWDEHLDDGQLFERTCQYLVTANEVPVFMAQRLVHLAMSKITPPGVTLGVDWGDKRFGDITSVVLIDSRDGIHHVINRRLLPHQKRFLAFNTPH